MRHWVRAILLSCVATTAGAALLAVSSETLTGGIQFVQNATLDADYADHTDLPNGFGDGRWTLQVLVRPYQTGTTGTTTGSPGNLQNWATENDAVGSSSTWWFQQNFLLDVFNNNSTGPGSFSIGVRGGGYVVALINDNDGSRPSGGVWGLQNFSGTNILSDADYWIAFVADDSGATDREYRLYVNKVLQASVTSGTRRDFYTNDWEGDSWSAYPGDEQGFTWGSEKQAANGDFDFPDFKGVVKAVVFSSDALSTADMQSGLEAIKTGQADYMDHIDFSEGSGTTATSANGLVVTLRNAQAGGFWP